MKRLVTMGLAVLMSLSLCACGGGSKNVFEDSFQWGKGEAVNDTKGKEKGSLSNPYLIGEVAEITGYELQGYNPATGVNTVANPMVWEIAVEDTFEVTDVTKTFQDNHEESVSFWAEVSIKIKSTTGDYAVFRKYVTSPIFLTTDRKESGLGLSYYTLREMRERSSYIKSRNKDYVDDIDLGNVYEGTEFCCLVGGFLSDIGVKDSAEAELFAIHCHGEDGESRTVYFSLHEHA